MIKKCFFVVVSQLIFNQVHASPLYYYPASFVDRVEQNAIPEADLKKELYAILTKTHLKNDNDHDTLSCDSQQANCYQAKALGYNGARKFLFGTLHLKQNQNGYYIQDVYCEKVVTKSQTVIGPNTIPNANVINTEHTWPQSRFSNSENQTAQVSDLHHLFPTDTKANSTRGNFEFTETDGSGQPLSGCSASHRAENNKFEPPTNHKGNVARALFYFSVRYKLTISAAEEAVLKVWAEEDPVDAEEIARNQAIFEVQKNRNPFIDFPDLYKKITNF